MIDATDDASELPRELLAVLRQAAEGRIPDSAAMARLEEVTKGFAREARRAGMTPEGMLVLLKRSLIASLLRQRKGEFTLVRERLVSVAIEAYFGGEDRPPADSRE